MGWISRGRLVELKGPTRGLLYGGNGASLLLSGGGAVPVWPVWPCIALDGRRDLVPLDSPQRKVRIGGRR